VQAEIEIAAGQDPFHDRPADALRRTGQMEDAVEPAEAGSRPVEDGFELRLSGEIGAEHHGLASSPFDLQKATDLAREQIGRPALGDPAFPLPPLGKRGAGDEDETGLHRAAELLRQAETGTAETSEDHIGAPRAQQIRRYVPLPEHGKTLLPASVRRPGSTQGSAQTEENQPLRIACSRLLRGCRRGPALLKSVLSVRRSGTGERRYG
jgi:hypothetical protein